MHGTGEKHCYSDTFALLHEQVAALQRLREVIRTNISGKHAIP